MIRSKIVFHQYFQHLWGEPDFCIPYRWHFLFHSCEHVLPIPTWWNPNKGEVGMIRYKFASGARWKSSTAISSKGCWIFMISFIDHSSTFTVNFARHLQKSYLIKNCPCCHFSRNIRLPPFFRCFTDPSCRVFQETRWLLRLETSKGVREISNRQESLDHCWIMVFCCFRNY